MPRPNPGGVHTTSGGKVIPLPKGPLLPTIQQDVASIVAYTASNGCDGSKTLHDFVVLFQATVNDAIAQSNQQTGLNEPFLPVDGLLAGATLGSVASYAKIAKLTFNGCTVTKTGGPGPIPGPIQNNGGGQPSSASSSNTGLYIGLGIGALALIAGAVYVHKRRARR